MDHVPLPKRPSYQPLRVPYLVSKYPHLTYIYADHQEFSPGDGGALSQRTEEFLDFPISNDIELSDLFAGDFRQRSLEEILAFLQSWCFFGLLKHTMWISGVDIADEDLITQAPTYDADGNEQYDQAITTSILPLLRVKVELKSRSIQSMSSHGQAAYREFSACLEWIMTIARDLNLSRTGNPLRASDYTDSVEPELRDSIMLSIYLLGDFLHYVLMLWLPLDTYPLEPNWTYIQFFPFLRQRLLENGWCPSEIDLLSDQPIGPSALLHLSFVDRTSLGKDHRACAHLGLFQCKYEKLEQYETQHAPTCSDRRPDSFHDVMKEHKEVIQQIVISHGIPIVTVHDTKFKDTDGTVSSISECTGTSLHTQIQSWGTLSGSGPKQEYVAFSHVWSDGLGNKTANALPACQLRRLQNLANAVSGRNAANPMPFWLDTLCVPLAKPFHDEAVAILSEIYVNAQIVLVLDAVILEKAVRDVHPYELLMAIRTSNWTRRLWTYEEGILARDLRFQFSDQSMSYKDIGFALAKAMFQDILAIKSDDHRSESGWVIQSEGAVTIDASEVTERLLEAHDAFYPPISYLREVQAPDFRDRDLDQTSAGAMIEALSAPLCWRSTARPTDEPICLSNILGMTNEARRSVAIAPSSDRMRVLLEEIRSVPTDILFVDRPRFREPGLRWMPRSLLGGGRRATMYRKSTESDAQHLADIMSSDSRITGIKLSRPGILLDGVINYSDMFFATINEFTELLGSDGMVDDESDESDEGDEDDEDNEQGSEDDQHHEEEEGKGKDVTGSTHQSQDLHERTEGEESKNDFQTTGNPSRNDKKSSTSGHEIGIVIVADPKCLFNTDCLTTRRWAVVLKSAISMPGTTTGALLSAVPNSALETGEQPLKFTFDQLVQVSLTIGPPKGRYPGNISGHCLPRNQEWIID